jgi:hypothetical protein
MGNRAIQYLKLLIKPFTPSYDEASLFFASITCIVLFATDSGLRADVFKIYTRGMGRAWLHVFIWTALTLLGLLLSLIHAFSSRKKTTLEKSLMAIFGMSINGLIGVQCGLEQLRNETTWLIIFPIINILSAVALFYQLGLSNLQDRVQDEDIRLGDVLLGSLILLGVFIYCSQYARLDWKYTYSICVAFTTTTERMIRLVQKRLIAKPAVQPNSSPTERRIKASTDSNRFAE